MDYLPVSRGDFDFVSDESVISEDEEVRSIRIISDKSVSGGEEVKGIMSKWS